jgi:hypothetical protein
MLGSPFPLHHTSDLALVVPQCVRELFDVDTANDKLPMTQHKMIIRKVSMGGENFIRDDQFRDVFPCITLASRLQLEAIMQQQGPLAPIIPRQYHIWGVVCVSHKFRRTAQFALDNSDWFGGMDVVRHYIRANQGIPADRQPIVRFLHT